MIFSQKSTLKDGISGIIEKDNIHPRKQGISFDRKIKDSPYFHGYLYRRFHLGVIQI